MNSKKKYMLRSYDTYYQDVRREHVADFISEDAAIEAAAIMLCLMYDPSDQMEIQILVPTLGRGEWQMIGACFYEDTDDGPQIVFEDCFC